MSEPKRPMKGTVEPFDKIALIADPPVRADLQLDDSMEAKIDIEIDRFNAAVRRVMASRMPREEVDRSIAVSRIEALRNIGNGLSGSQATRLQQLHWQKRGTDAIDDEELVKELKIGEDQLTQIRNRSEATAADQGSGTFGLAPESTGDFPDWDFPHIRKTLSTEQFGKLLRLLGKPLSESSFPNQSVDSKDRKS